MVGVCLSEIAASDFICCLICVVAKFFLYLFDCQSVLCRM